MFLDRNGFRLSQMLSLLMLFGVGFVASSAMSNELYAGDAPRITNVNSVLYGGFAYVTGYVTDADNDPTGWEVFVVGDVTGSATVGSDGMFWYRTPCHLPYGEGYVFTGDPDGNVSNFGYFEFYE